MTWRATLFFNPRAGWRGSVPPLRREAEIRGIEWIDISPDLDVRALARQRLASGVRTLIAAGGDGTIHHVIQSLVATEAVLGVVPAGTYNHFARDLGIPLDPLDALEVAIGGDVRSVDVGRANSEYFVNNLSLGFYPELVERREEQGRENRRWRALAYAAWSTYQRMPSVSITIEAPGHFELVRTHLFMVSNNAYDLTRAGIDAPRRNMESGRLSVYWLPHVPRVELIRMIARFVRGRLHGIGGLRSLRREQLTIGSSHATLSVGMDGELLEMRTPISVASIPSGLNVRVPR